MDFKRTYIFTFYILLFVTLISGSLLFNGCNSNKSAYVLTGNIVEDGKNLAQMNCAKCHAQVPANMLTKNVWVHNVLPKMAKYFKITPYLGGYYKNDTDTGGLSLIAYQSIAAYYEKLAPDTLLPVKPPVKPASSMAGFTVKAPAPVKGVSFTTMAQVDPFSHKIYTSDALTSDLTVWDSNFKSQKVTTLPSTALNALFTNDKNAGERAYLSCVGIVKRTDFQNGRVVRVDLSKGSPAPAPPDLVASELNRPVQTIEGDFNKDGLTDLVILAPGKLKGGVYLFKQNPDHSFIQSNISEQAGAVQAVAADFNNDGWLDIMVLFGSGDEGLTLFLNDHKGGFTSRRLLSFPPVYGSTSFQLADLDHDGKPDLIYTCGYNFNESRILKPYHGLYLFKNTGDWNFKQEWFYPINGCTQAIAADFGGGGKLDIITSAFFADLKNNPAESLMYFENDGPFSFKPHTIPVNNYGHWMSMSMGDYNNDGKPDIILGNYAEDYLQLGLKSFWSTNIPFIVLENNFKK